MVPFSCAVVPSESHPYHYTAIVLNITITLYRSGMLFAYFICFRMPCRELKFQQQAASWQERA